MVVDILYISRWTSSTKPPTWTFCFSLASSSTSGPLKKRKRTGEIGDPCGMPVIAGSIGDNYIITKYINKIKYAIYIKKYNIYKYKNLIKKNLINNYFKYIIYNYNKYII